MKKTFCLSTVLVVLLMVCNPMSSNAWMVLNDIDCAFEGLCKPDGSQGFAMIKAEIVSGAAYYLESHANIQLFLSRVERTDIKKPDFLALNTVLDRAIEQMENSRTAYFNLKSMAAATAYNSKMSRKFEDFDYFDFREENGLNPSVFRKVAGYLKDGNVRGVYNAFYNDVEEIVIQLYVIKQNLDSGLFPAFPQLYRLNQDVSETQLFGQYVTEVIRNIKNQNN